MVKAGWGNIAVDGSAPTAPAYGVPPNHLQDRREAQVSNNHRSPDRSKFTQRWAEIHSR